MVIPLRVKQIRHVLQQKLVPLLDLSDRHALGAGPDEPRILTRALAALAVWEHTGCSLEEAAASVVDGEKDGGMDALHITLNPPRIVVVQSKWRNPGNATIDSEAVNKLRDGFDDLTHGRLDVLNDRIKKLSPLFRQVQLDHDHKAVIITVLLGDDPVHPDQKRGLASIAQRHGEEFFEFRHMHLADIHRATRHGMSRQAPELAVELIESFRREARRDHTGKVIRQEAYIGTVKARAVCDWVDTYGERLYDQNLRGSLGSTNVNRQIRATLQTDPRLFWTLNKGITLVADQVKRGAADSGSYSAPAHLTLSGASIVDGAQTASSVHRVVSDLQGLALEAEIPIKIISLEGATPDLAKRIAFAANTQNAILQRDFASADPAQEELQFELDQLGKRYVYRRSEELAISGEDTCRIEEVALALICAQADAGLIARVKKNDDALWDPTESVYKKIFQPVPDARLAWNATLLLRGVLTETGSAARHRTSRIQGFAQNADWLICHILLRLIDQKTIPEASEAEWHEQIIRSRGRYDEVLDRLIHHTDAEYGTGAYPASTFRDEVRSKVLAGRVLADLRTGVAPPQLPEPDRRRGRARNAVEYIHDSGILPEGTVLVFRSNTRTHREVTEAWIADHPEQARATWIGKGWQPLLWEVDGRKYAPSPLAMDLIEKVTGRRPRSVRGPDCWVAPDGRTLTQLADEGRRRGL